MLLDYTLDHWQAQIAANHQAASKGSCSGDLDATSLD